MTSPCGEPGVPQIQRQSETVRRALKGLVDDLLKRAEINSTLLRSAQAPRHLNGVVTVSYPADAWFAAIEADMTPISPLPPSPKSLADHTETELREFVRAEFARPPAEPI